MELEFLQNSPAPKNAEQRSAVAEDALHQSVAGLNLRRIRHLLGVTHQTVANWVAAHARTVPEPPQPPTPETVELDELFTFVGDTKTASTS